MNDNELIDKTLAGDSASFGRLITKYQDRLYSTLVHLLGSPEDARDTLQDALLQAYVKLRTFHRDSSFYTWIYRICVNWALSRKRREKPQTSLDYLRERSGIEPSDMHMPEDHLNQTERAGHVQAALSRIGEEHRTVLILREIDDHDYETISQILDVPIGTVRSRLHRARLELREQLKHVYEEQKK